MASSFQSASLVAAPLYPNAIVWSEENLIAVASGHLVTILNPAVPYGARGVIEIRSNDRYLIGTVKRADLLTGCLLPIALSRDRSPCVRSVSWSPIGVAPNSGCLLAVCTIDGRVKLYCPPFCDFHAEWIEIVDISDMLYSYLADNNFGEDVSSSKLSNEQAMECESPNDPPYSVSTRGNKRKRAAATGNKGSKASREFKPCCGRTGDATADSKSKKRMSQTSQISAEQYASRSAMLHSLVVAWSPVLRVLSRSQNSPANRFSLLAIGGKSGKISIWKIHVPQCYSIEQRGDPLGVLLGVLLEAHNSWVTAISWYLLPSNSSRQQILLVTGSSDGSVKIWIGHSEELTKSSDGKSDFSLLKEVIPANTIPVSVLSVVVPVQSPHEMLLAIGKGSGSLEVWKCDISSRKFDNAGAYDAHSQIVTGLAWAFDGLCLYSTSQDNFVRSWILCGDSTIVEVPLPSNTPGLRSSTDLPDNFFSSLGVAISPGNLVLAMVRNYDCAMLDQMYEARVQKAAVEFLWIGGQLLDTLRNISPQFDIKAFSGFNEKELGYWESNILWSLKQYEYLDKPLVVWDIITALLAFKQSIPNYVEHVVLKWLTVSYLRSNIALSAEKILSNASRSFSKTTSRQLHILNTICRRVLLSELKADQISSVIGEACGSKDEQTTLWMKLLLSSENELRERLVCFSFSSFISLVSGSASPSFQPDCWCPVGLAQMEQWVARNCNHVRKQLKSLASTVGTLDKRVFSSSYVPEEQCSLCLAPVPFNSPEVAFCQGSGNGKEEHQGCKLERCSVSIQICPMNPMWCCKCCNRRTFKLPPETLLAMPGYPSGSDSSSESVIGEVLAKPFCPFCGVLLQRLQPDFLLSASPV